MRSAHLALVALLIVVGSAAGTFAGSWAWRANERAEAARQQRAAASAAEAEARSPRGIQRAKVLEHLHDPDSAVFKDDHPSVVRAQVWCGLVNARNRMGAMVGFTRYVIDTNVELYLISQEDPVSDDARARQRFFEGYWADYCADPPALAAAATAAASGASR